MIRKLLLLVKLLFTTIFTENTFNISVRLACLGMFFVVSNVNSQVANYTFSQSNGTYTAITGSNAHTAAWDDVISTVNLGFTFTYNNVNYTTCSVNTNGYITLGTNTSATNGFNPISATTGYAGAISALGRDLISNGSNIIYAVTGTAPNRVFVVQWANARRYEARNNSGESFNFQIRLSESSNLIQVVYGACSVDYTSDLNAQVGLRGTSNTDFNNREITSNWSASTTGTNNAANAVTGTGKLPASGLTFTWTPALCSFSNFGTVTQITNVKFNSINNTSTGTTSYENFKVGSTTPVAATTVYKDQSYSLNVKGNTGGNVNYFYTAFFDWNQDGDFLDADEYYVIGTFRDSPTQNVVASVFVKIPATALLGNTTMRVIGHLGSYNTTPCAASDANNAGQVEDYTITVGATCTASPTPGATISTANPVCSTTPFTLSLANETLGAPTYQWQTSANGTDWVNATPSQPAFFSSDFSTPQAPNSTVGIESVSGLDAKIAGGVLILTDITETGHQSAYFINKSLGSNVNAFTASFDYRTWLGPTDGADGLSLSYGDGFINNNGGGENGEGNGLILKLDTYDNDQVAVGGRIRINYGGNAIFATAIGAVTLRNINYRNITLSVDNNGYLSLSLAGTSIITNLLLPGYAATDKSTWKFKFSARTGGNKDQHSIDNLSIKYLDVSANKSIYTTTQTAPTYYRALVTCGSNTTPSTGVLINMISAVIAPITSSTCSGVAFNVTPTGTIPAGTTYSWGIPTVTGGAGALTGGAASIGAPTTITGTLTNTTTTVQTATYTVTPTTSGCAGATFTVTVTVNPNATVTVTSAAATTSQAVCINTPITNITYTTTNATGATFSGLPTGVTGSWSAGVVTISGIPSAVGTFNYTVNLTGCGNVTATGTITVNPNATVTITSAAATTSQAVCINTPITNITYTTTNATGATFSGLPTGVTGSWTAGVVTISGTPSAVGTSNYTVNLTGCGNVTATGTITVNPNATVTLTSPAATTNQGICVNTPITNITYTTVNATGATFSGLPTGVTGSWSANVVTISGSPSVTAGSPYTYTVNLTGCGNVSATGTITVNPNATVTRTSNSATTNQVVCTNTPITNITYTTTNATGATFSGLPTGVTGSWTAGVVTISGTPSVTAGSPYTYTVNLTGCGNVSATGTITVNPNKTITLTSAAATTSQSTCVNTSITNITYTTANATGATFSGLPTGVTGLWSAGAITINGSPSVTGAFNYTVNLTGCGNAVATGTINVNALPTISQQPLPLEICQGQNGSFTVVTSATSPTYQWEYRTSVSGPWTVTNAAAGVSGHNIATLSLTNVPVNYSGYYLRCVVTSNTCSTISNPVLLTVNPLPTAPTVGTPSNVTCTTSGSVMLTNLPVGNWTLVRNPGAIPTSGSGSTYTVTGLAIGNYTFTVSNGSCNSAASSIVSIGDQSSTTWNSGTGWSNGIPDPSKAAIINAAFTVSSDLMACSLTINAGIAITVPSNYTLTVVNALTVLPSASLTFENHSSLVQVNDNAVNSGNITYKRIAVKIRRGDFTYWSTPVNPHKLIAVSPQTIVDKFWGYTGDKWLTIDPNTNMMPGKGYAIRGPQNYSTTVKADYPAEFKGTPNNGVITGETLAKDKYYLIGNPYPSALNAADFLDANRFLTGTLYFWTHNTGVDVVGYYKYSASDYASYNITGGVIQQPAPSGSNPGNTPIAPSGNIGAGQSFFALTSNAGTVTFKNSMRRGAANNTQFFKTGKTTDLQRHRIWLNLTNKEGAFKQMLIGYVEGATNQYEDRYDGLSFNANPYIDFYSMDNQNNYVIQGRALPFTDSDQVPLGYSTTIVGDFTISIDELDGDLKNQAIFLEDKKTGTIHDLRTGDYTFTTEKGTFADRFVLRYTNKTLGTGDFENVENGLLVSVKEKTIKVFSSRENIKEVNIFDVTGKLLYSKNKVGTTELQIQNLSSPNQVLLVKVTLDNGFTNTKKIIFN